MIAPTIPLEALDWEDPGEDGSQLVTSIRIGHLYMHLEAFEVGTLSIADTIAAHFECDFQTIEINGRDYVLIATPFGM